MANSGRKDIHNSDIPALCRSCEARHGGICGVLTPKQLTELSKFTNRTSHSRDVPLKTHEDDDSSRSNVLSGVVKLTKLLPDGRQQIVGLQFAPDLLGRPLSNRTDIIAEAATEVSLCSFPKSVLDRFLKQVPEMEHRLHEQHMRELDEAREWMLTLGRKTAVEKVASFIVLIANHSNPERADDGRPFDIELPLKRADIADFLGLTIETVSRQFTNLRKMRVIDTATRTTVTILDLDRLYEIANDGS